LSYVNLLLENGADPNVKESHNVGGETPIFKAVENNSYEVVKLLLDYGADPGIYNKGGLNSLHIAAKNGFLEVCLLLISRGLDPNMRDEFGNNATYWAKRNKFDELLKYLPPVQTVNAEELVEYHDQMDEMMFGLNADEKKKMQAKKGKK
jgi:ankyrin repeat protein